MPKYIKYPTVDGKEIRGKRVVPGPKHTVRRESITVSLPGELVEWLDSQVEPPYFRRSQIVESALWHYKRYTTELSGLSVDNPDTP